MQFNIAAGESGKICALDAGLDRHDGLSSYKAVVDFPGRNSLTSAAICASLAALKPGHRHIRAACALLSSLARGDVSPASPKVDNMTLSRMQAE